MTSQHEHRESPRAKRRNIRRPKPKLSIAEILAWADAHHQRLGQWPKKTSGRVRDTLYESWSAVDAALKQGLRSLPGRSSLARLLFEKRGVRSPAYLPPLSPEVILEWADAHFQRLGTWPSCMDGAIADAPGESWVNVDALLRGGGRTLPGGSSLPRLLEQERGVRNRSALPRLTERQILAWADAHYQHTGAYPRCVDGTITDAPEETWGNVDAILRAGGRGLPGGSSLPQLLERRRGVPNFLNAPDLTEEDILAWVDDYHAKTGFWPSAEAGPMPDGPPLQWISIDACLRYGRRGLPGGSSLARLLKERRGVEYWSKEKMPGGKEEG